MIGCFPYVPQQGIKPATLWCIGLCSNQLNHLGRASFRCILKGESTEFADELDMRCGSKVFHQSNWKD